MSIKVLLVDDEEQFTEALASRLETRGILVTTASCGADAVDFLKEHDVDVVILDVQMPGMTGTETLREIKQLKPLTEVIMLTGHSTVATAIEGMKLGAYDYLIKPTDIVELVEKMTQACGRKRDHEERIKQAEIDRLVRTRGW